MGSILLNYKKLVKEAKIDINEGYSLTSHDNRKMFLSILSFSGTDSDLADRCLSHSGKGGMKQVYLDVPYRIRKEIFEDWWNFLREIGE
jgi:integrase